MIAQPLPEDATVIPVRIEEAPAATEVDDGSAPYPSDRPNLSPAGTYLGSAARKPHTHGAFARRAAPDPYDAAVSAWRCSHSMRRTVPVAER